MTTPVTVDSNADKPGRAARAALAIALASACWSAGVVASGGIDLREIGVPLLARTAWPTTVVAGVLLAACVFARRARVGDDLNALVTGLRWLASGVAVGLSIVTVVLAIRFGTFAVGGSDSNCYVEQAERWAAGTMLEPIRPGFTADWPNAALSLTPTGFVPSRTVAGAIAPICPAGLSLAMAIPRALGAPRPSVFYVVPLLAGLAVFCTFSVGRRLAGPLGGLSAAALVAASPAFLYQAVQPMSDVPATAFWLLALACAGRGTPRALSGSGLAAGAAILMRPNLAPLAVLFVAFAGLRDPGRARGWTTTTWRAGLVVAGLLPSAIAVAAVQYLLYGSPLSSGYGSLDALFRVDHVPVNLQRFPRWLVETQSPFPLLGLFAPFLLAWRRARRPGAVDAHVTVFAWLVWLFVLGAFAAYLPYVPFDGWWFLRFWLPGVPPLIALAVCSTGVAVGRWGPGRFRPQGTLTFDPSAEPPATEATPQTLERVEIQRDASRGSARVILIVLGIVACVVLSAWQLGVARDRAVFDLRRFERKFVVAGRYVGTLPSDAVVLTIWHSGAVKYYGDRPSVVWDAVAPGGLDAVVDSLRAQGREVYLLLEPREEVAFRTRFGASSPVARLDWPPRARFGNEATLWALADRERFLRGEATPSERVWMQ